jgi:[methyl-Co(III) methanol-specific corrinoid protein]:coenzyme M methyltransferase
MLNSRERVLAVFQGVETDRAAVINLTSVERTGVEMPGCASRRGKDGGCGGCGHELCGFDSVMPKFSIVHSAAALGAEIDWMSGDAMPVIKSRPVSDPAQFKIPADFLDRPETKVVLDAIKLLKKRYGDKIAVCGKVFGPWTTAYNLVGTEEFLVGTILEPQKTKDYIEVFTPVGIKYAEAQFEAGADMILWGDHVSGDLCGPEAYAEYLLPAHKRINKTLLKKGGPVILHACGRTLDRLKYFAESGFEAFHFDSLNDTGEALRIIKKSGSGMLLAGGVSNETLLRGTPEDAEREAAASVSAGIRLISPECAISMRTPNTNLSALIRAVNNS